MIKLIDFIKIRLLKSRNELTYLPKIGKNKFSVEVSFTGGMGAQILSAAIFFDLRLQGYSVTADLSYFNQPSHIAKEGNRGEISRWDWQLDKYNLTASCFDPVIKKSKMKKKLPDGALKLRLGMEALKSKKIKEYFPLAPLFDILSIVGIDETFLHFPYICLHIRRGDYINVSSYLVPDDHFVQLSQRFSHLVNQAVVVSDSILDENLKQAITEKFTKVHFIDDGSVSAFVTHGIMRHAAVLICSNSQYSLTAGALSSNLVVFPEVWFGSGHKQLKAQLKQLSNFVLLN